MGFVQTHDAGFGARNPATASHCGSSALVETFQFEASTPAAPLAVGCDAAGAGLGAAGAGTIGAGGFGAGASEHAESSAETETVTVTSNDEVRSDRMGP